MFMTKKISIKDELAVMKVGEEKSFPPEMYRSVTVACSDYGFLSRRIYSVRKDREKYKVIVTRKS